VTSRFAASGSVPCASRVQTSGARPATELAREDSYAEPFNGACKLIDTADAYGPGVSEELVADALHPYNDPLIATKGRYERTGPSGESSTGELIWWTPNGRPEHLRSACEASLRRLRLERIDLYQFHTPDPSVRQAESIGALSALRVQGKIRHIGVSNVTPELFAVARAVTDIATVQNRLNLDNRWHDMLTECGSHGVGSIPYHPLRAWRDPTHRAVLTTPATQQAASTDQIALAWLQAVSPLTLPIPGPPHLRTWRTTSLRPRSNSNKTRYTRSARRH
jgi:pyridoxine 4-dehydrogenase